MDFEYTNTNGQFKPPRGCFHAQHPALLLSLRIRFDPWYNFGVLGTPRPALLAAKHEKPQGVSSGGFSGPDGKDRKAKIWVLQI